jgi:hypothetical protein
MNWEPTKKEEMDENQRTILAFIKTINETCRDQYFQKKYIIKIDDNHYVITARGSQNISMKRVNRLLNRWDEYAGSWMKIKFEGFNCPGKTQKKYGEDDHHIQPLELHYTGRKEIAYFHITIK